MSNGPAITAPVGISMAMTTPPVVGSTIQLNPLQRHEALVCTRVLRAVHREQHRLEDFLHVRFRPGGRVVAVVHGSFGDCRIAVAKHYLEIKDHG